MVNSFLVFILCVSSTSLVIVFAPSKDSAISNISSENTTEKLSTSSISMMKSNGIVSGNSDIELGGSVSKM